METNTDISTTSDPVATAPLSDTTRQAIYNLAAKHLISGKTGEEVIPLMVDSGLPEQEARVVVSQFRQEIAQAKLDKANKDVLYGALWCGGGLLVTIISYSAVSGGGGTYFVFWGAVIFGAIQLVRGLANQGTAKRELEEAQSAA